MVERLESVNWESLEHAFGRALDVPANLDALQHEDPGRRQAALEVLESALCHQGSVYSASVAALPFLIETAVSDCPERAEIIDLIHYMVTGDPTAWQLSGLDPADEEVSEWLETDPVRRRLIEVASQRASSVAALLEDPLHGVRLGVARLLSMLAASASDVVPRIRTTLEKEPNDAARASLVLCLGHLDSYLGSEDDVEVFRALAHSDSALVRAAAAISLARVTSPPDPTLADLLEQVENEGAGDDTVGDLSLLAAQFRRKLGFGPDFATLFEDLQARLSALEPDPDGTFSAWNNERYAANKAFVSVFRVAFPVDRGEHDELLPEDLTTEQRRLLELYIASAPLWKWDDHLNLFASAGLLHRTDRDDSSRITPTPLRRFLGQVPPHAEDVRIHVTTRKHPGTSQHWPIWKAIRQVLSGGLEREELLRACGDEVEDDTLIEVVRAVFARRGWLLPTDGWLRWTGLLGSEIGEEKEAYVEHFVETMVDLISSSGPEGERYVRDAADAFLSHPRGGGRATALFLVRALARYSPDGIVDAHHAGILKGHLNGRAARNAFRVLPPQARSELVRGVELVRMDYKSPGKKYLDTSPNWFLIELCPTVEAAERIVDALQKLGSSKDIDARRMIESLSIIGRPAAPLLRTALDERKIRREIVLEALAAVEGPDAADLLVQHLLGSSKPMREAAVRGIVSLGDASESILADLESSRRKKARDAAAELRRLLVGSSGLEQVP